MTDKQSMEAIARRLRAHAVQMVHRSKAPHLGNCLSMADILTVLYWKTLSIDPARPDWAERDSFFLSKGHGVAILYAALAERGFFLTNELDSYCQPGSRLTGHATAGVPGVEISSGSLGHALPVACGVALAAKREKGGSRCFVLVSDGELDEGSNWEAILFASHHRLDNLILIVDYNCIQSFGRTGDVQNLDPLSAKFEAFGWACREIDGHNLDEVVGVLDDLPAVADKPTVVIASTVKGKGVSFMEDRLAWHYKSPDAEQMEEAMKELRGRA